MSEPPAFTLSTGGENFKPRVSNQRRADPPSAVSPVTAVPVVVRAAEPPALVARVVARQQDPNLGLPTYKSQINGRSILRVEGNKSEAPPLSDSAVKSIEEARRQQQEDRTRSTKPSPPASLATKTIKTSNSNQEPVRSKNVTSTKSHSSAPPTASPKPMKQGSVKKLSSSPLPASPKPTKQRSVQKVIPPPSPVSPAHEPAPVSPIVSKAPSVHRPVNETWEFVPPQQERGSCCVII